MDIVGGSPPVARWKVVRRETCLTFSRDNLYFSSFDQLVSDSENNLTLYVWFGVCKTSARCIGRGKQLSAGQVWTTQFVHPTHHEFHVKLTSAEELGGATSQHDFSHSKVAAHVPRKFTHDSSNIFIFRL